MKVYITKYALTDGIYECEARKPYEYSEGYQTDGTDESKAVKVSFRIGFFTKGNWTNSASKAVERAKEMRDRRLQSLKKQIEKLENMKFTESDIIKARQ